MRGRTITVLTIFLVFTFFYYVFGSEIDIPASEYSVEELTKTVDKKEIKEEIKESEIIKQNPEQEKAAKEINNFINSKDYIEKIENYASDFYNFMGIDKYYPDMKKNISIANNISDSKIYIFISSSIPLETIRNYVTSIVRYGLEKDTVFVLRGFIGNDISKVKPTLNYINKIIYLNPSCDPTKDKCEVYKVEVNIDPLIFARLGIKKVPALSVISNIQMIDPTQSLGKEGNAEFKYSVVYGDAKLEYLLTRLYEETKDENVKKYIDKIGG